MTTTAEASVVTAAGDLDLAVTAQLATLLRREVRLAPPALVFDASAVTFCSARVLTILLETAADSVPFAVAGRCRPLLRPITALGLDLLLPVHWNAAEAVAWLKLARQLT
ncbi:STAS domain-containing protein [Amycolatopsis mongoliensis]|uniref:STAS domain-containing protein n=1 Tax=Amycolatopsis mongoliensis TaxID=715475 RepID=A0A9Y2JQZ1_9PSEU|nr:STAS domain-containing protein [Amycolatopsis sp. 4-36]WIY03050.1 STAS domain-containing protein [Amycolatopsis sp. 4-36]